jgi:ribosomal-protein-alanine N-acetyltransferase
MLYRLYQSGDLAPLYAIEELCFDPPFRFDRALMRKLIVNPNSATWIAEESGIMAAFAIVDWATVPKGTIAYIQTIEVHPGSRRRGIAAGLLSHAEDSARTACATAIWLHVDVENSAAIALYERSGYVRKRREEHFYARHRPAFVYAKTLSGVSNSAPVQ